MTKFDRLDYSTAQIVNRIIETSNAMSSNNVAFRLSSAWEISRNERKQNARGGECTSSLGQGNRYFRF